MLVFMAIMIKLLLKTGLNCSDLISKIPAAFDGIGTSKIISFYHAL